MALLVVVLAAVAFAVAVAVAAAAELEVGEDGTKGCAFIFSSWGSCREKEERAVAVETEDLAVEGTNDFA